MGGILEYTLKCKESKNILPNSIYSDNMHLSFHTHLYLVPRVSLYMSLVHNLFYLIVKFLL